MFDVPPTRDMTRDQGERRVYMDVWYDLVSIDAAFVKRFRVPVNDHTTYSSLHPSRSR